MSRHRDLAGTETAELQALVEQLLGLLGEDPTREGLLKTPERVAKALRFFTQGYQQDVEEVFNGALYSDRKSTRLNSSHGYISYAVFCLKKKKKPLVHHRDYM